MSSTAHRDADAIDIWNELYDPDDAAIWGDDPAAFVTEDVAALWRRDAARDILVIPSGDGRNVRSLLEEFPGILCADTSQRALARLRRMMLQQGRAEPQTRICDVYAPDALGMSFDSILCWDLLSHLDSPRVAIAGLLRCLRPGGSLVVNFFADDDPSIIDDRSTKIGPKLYRNDHDICYQLYDETDARAVVEGLDPLDIDLRKISWWEDPHPGYRPYRHMHRGLAMILRARS